MYILCSDSPGVLKDMEYIQVEEPGKILTDKKKKEKMVGRLFYSVF